MKIVLAFVILAVAISVEAAPSTLLKYSEPIVYSSPLYRSAPIFRSEKLLKKYVDYREPLLRKALWNEPLWNEHLLRESPEVAAHHISPRIIYSHPKPYEYAAYEAPAHVEWESTDLKAKYLAINRGTIHSADLPGHDLSATSVNLEAAPGTF